MNLAPQAKRICRRLLGEPNQNLSTKAQWRYGAKGSLAIEVDGATAASWFDHEAKEGGGLLDLICRERRFTNGEAFAWLETELGIKGEAPGERHKVTGTWVYRDRDGNPLYRVVRRDCPGAEKRIHQERYDAAKGKFVSGKRCMAGVPLVPYRLNDWVDAEGPILIAEGERKVDWLFDLGWLATCSPGGAGKFAKSFAPYFQSRALVLLPDNDDAGRTHARKVSAVLEPVAASIGILELPGLPPKGDVIDWLEAGGTAEQLRELVEAAPSAADMIATWPDSELPPEPERRGCPYFVTPAGITWRKYKDDVPIDQPLTNFAAVIVGEVERDDGAERTLRFEIESELEGRKHRFEIGAEEFASLSWATREMGARALVYPGFALRDHARAAIQMLSADIRRRQVFGHLGWREIGGRQVYLHAGGGIDADGLRRDVETDLRDLELFDLPAPGEPKASIAFLDLAPREITAPLFATVWRAPLGSTDFTAHIAGQTGVFKSELAALLQQHYGANLNSRHLTSWASTANSLEVRAFTAKDAVFVVDDFAPSGAASDVQRAHREAARLVRAQGNQAGRDRLRPDGTLRPPKPPRCALLSTGEDIPGGQSIRARTFVIEVGAGDVDQPKLAAAQREAHKFAGAMSAYIQHLARDLEGHRRRFTECAAELRAEAQDGHRRTAWITGELGAALELYLRFVGRLDLWPGCWRAIKETAGRQAEHQMAEDPARRFVALVGALLSSKTAHLARADDPDDPPFDHVASEAGWLMVVPEREGKACDDDKPAIWKPQGPRIGWIDQHGITAYLEPEAAYSAAQRLASSQGQVIGVGARTLWKRLAEAGLLAMSDPGRNAYKAYIGKGQKNTIAISIDAMAMYLHSKTGLSRFPGCKPSKAAGEAELHPDFSSRFSDGGEKTGCKIGMKPEGNGDLQGGKSRSSRKSRFSNMIHGQSADRAEHDGQPWANDPAEWHNWATEPWEASISGNPETGFSETTRTCDQPGCGHVACLTGLEGSWCADHLEPWQRRAVVCVHCSDPIEAGEGSVKIRGGAILHNRCADAWARR